MRQDNHYYTSSAGPLPHELPQSNDEVEALLTLHELSIKLLSAPDTDSLYESILDAATAIMRSQYATMQMYIPERKGLYLLATRNFPPASIQHWQWISIGCESTACGQAMREGKRSMIDDIPTFSAGTEDCAQFAKLNIGSMQSTPLLSRSGEMVGMISTHWKGHYRPTELEFRLFDILARQASDLIERKQAEEKLHRSLEINRRIVDSTSDCIKVLDLEGHVLSVKGNAGALEIDDPALLLGKYWPDFWPKEERDRVTQALSAALSHGQAVFEGLRTTLHSKTPKWWHVVITPILDSHGKPIQLLTVSRDITDKKQYEDSLKASTRRARKANKAKSEFLANMSHEIRTPMNAIVGLSHILSLTSLDDKQRKFVSTLQSSANSLLALINDLLDIEKIKSQPISLERLPTDLAALVEEVCSMMQVRAEEKGLRVTCDLAAIKGKTYIADPTRLRQILNNLMSNAIKFTEQGSVHLAATAIPDTGDNETVTLTVTDTGIGIAPEKMEVVFNKFVQADSSITRKYGGSGLGLSICKTLVEIMDGRITLTSKPGVGSCFVVALPLARQRPGTQSSSDSRAYETPATTAGASILLVEDYAPNILVATTMLEAFGHRCDIASNGQEAIEKAVNGGYDVVLMDVQMPGLDGLEATARIREYEEANALPRVPIIGMTAHALVGDRERCVEAGMDDYISKPFNPDELQRKLEPLVPPAAQAA